MTRRVILFVLGIAAAGALLNLLREDDGAIFFGAALVAAGVILFLAGRARRRGKAADFPATFAPHVAVRLALRGQRVLIQGRHRGVFAVGRNGFTVRFDVPPDAAAQRIEAEFLKPDVALPHFSPGAAFSVVDGRQLVADGEVIDVLGQNEAHDPGQGRRAPV